MPCLNEQDNLVAACRSLGFGRAQEAPERCFLVLVDNGSTDATLDVCRRLRDVVGDAIAVVREPRRGHVPARHCGNVMAARVAAERGIPRSEVIVIQADADTRYSPGYVDAVRKVISNPSVVSPVGQAVTRLPPDLATAYPTVFARVDSIDREIEQRFGFSRYDFVVDDKACAYGLGDYVRWGGHRREYFGDGLELLAETTRLTIAGLAYGAERIDIVEASVVHSQRRLLSDAAQELAAAGFPYVGRRIFPDTQAVTLEHLERGAVAGDRKLLASISTVRAAHLAALMVVLPAHVGRALTGVLPADPGVRRVVASLPLRSIDEVVMTPGCLLGDVLDLALSGSQLLEHLDL
jgi:hypothetical protein